jgi:hypothetical protein
MPMWGSDTGGYLRSASSPTEEVFARWFGLAAYSPMMEVLVGDSHTPWYNYSPALVEIARKHTTAHHDLIPYTRSFVQAATTSGAPVMRPLVFSFPDDPSLANRSDEYLFGSELLVAPILSEGAQTRAVYVPQGAGRWLDYNGRRTVVAAGETATLPAPLDTIPVLVREGGIVPRGRLLRGNDDWTPSWSPALRIEFYPAQGDLDRHLDYFTGSAVQPIRAATAGGTVTVSFGELGAPGTVELALTAAGKVSRNGMVLAAGKDYQLDAAARLLTVPFSGATTLVVEGARSVFAPAVGPDAGAAAGGSEGGCGCTVLAPHARRGALAWILLVLLIARLRRRL